MLSDFCCVGIVGILALLLMVQRSFEKPVTADSAEINANKTKPRILTHPPTDFYDREQEIVFPDAISDRIDVLTRLSGPPTCAGQLTFCETVDAYPYAHIKRVLEGNTFLKSFFSQDEAPVLQNRLGDEDETFVCSSSRQLVFPRLAETKNHKWKVIINQADNSDFKQAVQIEVCRSPNSTCDIPGSVADGFTFTCKQKYLSRKLVCLDNKGEPMADSFSFPSGCSCAYKHSVDFSSRFGKDVFLPPPNKPECII